MNFHFRRLSLRPLLAGGLVGLVGAVGFFSGALHSWSDRISDRFFVPRVPDRGIVVVAIDDVSLTRIGRWPWDRAVHAELIRRISAGNPAAIGYDVNFPEPQDEVNDQALAEAIRSSGRVVLPQELVLVDDGRGGLSYDPAQSVLPTPFIRANAASLGHTNTPTDEDGVVRRIPLLVRASAGDGLVHAFAFELTRVAGREASNRFSYTSEPVRIDYPGAPHQTFQTIRASDVLSGTFDPTRFSGRIVLVGATAPDLHDERTTPIGDGVLMPGVEIHASFLDALLGGHRLETVSPWWSVLLLLALGFWVGGIVCVARARWSLLSVMGVWAALLVVSSLLFDQGFVLDLLWPTFVLAAAYAIATVERRLSAEQGRRELRSVFSRYVSPTVVDAIMADPAKLALGGERRHMSVLFSDIRGFTTLAEGMSPEKLVRLLNAYLDRMTDVVFAHGGVLDKYIGDAVMAFWNAPFDQPDHARRAVATAIAMRDALREMNAAKAFGEATLKIGVGINTGDVVVGNIGGHARHDYTVIGDNVNLASRVEGLTKEYGIEVMITGSTAEEAGSEILARRIDLAVVKGKTEPVSVYEVMCLASRATEEEKRLVHDFEISFSKYLKRDFVGSSATCADILSRHPQDGPTTLLINRCATYIKNPPPEGWNGAWVFTKK